MQNSRTELESPDGTEDGSPKDTTQPENATQTDESPKAFDSATEIQGQGGEPVTRSDSPATATTDEFQVTTSTETLPTVVASGPAETSSPEVTVPATATAARTGTSSTAAQVSGNVLQASQSRGSQSPGISSGALAGGIAGAVAVTFLLTFAAMYAWMRKRRVNTMGDRRRRSKSRLLTHGAAGAAAGTGAATAIHRGDSEKSQELHAWEQYLPQDLDDRAIQGAVKVLFDEVHLHVENFYTNAQIDLAGDDTTSLAKLQTPSMTLNLAALMQSTASPSSIIKHSLAYMITQRSGIEPGSVATLLPPEFSMAAVDRSMLESNSPKAIANRQAYGKWKALTTYFRPDPQAGQSLGQAQKQAIADLVEVFIVAFEPWRSDSSCESVARDHLTELLSNASGVAEMLFKQNGTYATVWEQSVRSQTEGPRRLRVTPELVKVTDEECRLIDRPQVLITAVEEAI